ncbi:MAG: SMC-Scp complex subunit ScpB [Bdellovibrionota bacterium]
MEKLKSILDSLFFIADKPITTKQLEDILPEFSKSQIRQALTEMIEEPISSHAGIVLYEIAGGYQYRTHPENASWVANFTKAKPVRLSRAQLEALSIIAYRQPVTKPEIDDIRGVDSGGVIRVLVERGLVRILGKRDEPGHPLLYGTSNDFLSFFNLKNLSDLPPLQEYTELGEDSLKKLAQLFPESTDIEQNLQEENILPLEEGEASQPAISSEGTT